MSIPDTNNAFDDMQKIVDNEKLVKEMKDGKNTSSL